MIVGLEMLPWTATLVLVAPFSGKAVDKFGVNIIAMLGMLFQGLGYLSIALMSSSKLEYSLIVVPLMIAGVGLSMAGPALQKKL